MHIDSFPGFLICPAILFRHISHRLLVAVVFVFICIPTVFSGDFFPVTVRSEYYDSRAHTWGNVTLWIFRQESPRGICVSGQGSDESVIILTYDLTGRLEHIEKRIRRGKRFVKIEEVPQSPVVLSQGFPVPFDELLPFDEHLTQANIVKKAGSQTFSYKVTREITGISPSDAVSSGMVDQKTAETLGVQDMRLITIRKAGALVVRQLWAEGEDFWLYEETPLRRSWRVSISVAP